MKQQKLKFTSADSGRKTGPGSRHIGSLQPVHSTQVIETPKQGRAAVRVPKKRSPSGSNL